MTTGLPPLEYSDCFLDSPSFRETIALYEQELESNTKVVKNLVKECDNMIQKTEEFSRVQQSFGHALSQFHFKTIGTEQTEDEQRISTSLQSFSRLLLSIEDYRHNMLNAIRVRLLKTLQQFRIEHMKKTLEEKKRFDDASKKYYAFLDNFLSTKPPKRKDGNPGVVDVPENDQFEREKAQFRQISFDYVCHLQDVHAQKHFELVEPIIGYITDISTFLHQAYEEVCSLRPQIEGAQFKVQLLRETHESEQEKAYHLKAQVIEEGQHGMVHHPEYVKQGLVMILDKRRGIAGHHWQKYFCQFRKEEKRKMVKFLCNQKSPATPTDEWMEVKDCVRAKAEEIERRFCFELKCSLKGAEYKIILQGIGQEDRTSWLQVMEGREPVYSSLRALETGRINAVGYKFVEKCINTIEERGLEEEGLYRRPGVLAKANKLMKEVSDSNAVENMDFSDEIEWDTKTLASSVKAYFAKYLGEPVLTFERHYNFINAAKINDTDEKCKSIQILIRELPKPNYDILSLLIPHLRNIADLSSVNLMKASNLGVCFGPTLMRPEHETVASIVDIRYQNIIVEFMISHVDELFPGAREDRPYPRTKGMKTTSKLSRSEPSIRNRRPPPAAPVKISAANFAKRSQEQRAQSMIGSASSSSSVLPIVSNKDIPPPPVSQRQSVALTPPAYSTSGQDRNILHESGQFDHLESKKPVPTQRQTSVQRIAPQPPPTATKPHSQSSPPEPPPSEAKPSILSRRAKALFDCEAEDELELSFREDEIFINVVESEEPDWLQATNSSGKRGLVPANYIEWLT
ncbi:PREDICTED: rho GTPase-activating protein 10-like isoform X2 [Amphimedon queenslandica]|uniref:Rho GTPase-activating protein 26 n=1 Tax=Amphimedon queenslandica TaxID=400682 RepID=A0AAN0J431_AMPQE|nr:PREDICTED: rho GTPase-activating protein 10-like isoform X2 [Amphimedon queenslandica]|eukprot:XP_019851473.1 PREDICTED: rho GTPase-activating protein 10-like isoform X2 [Amphimedon queenslandica]